MLNTCRVDGKSLGYYKILSQQHTRFKGFWVSHKEMRKITFAQPKFKVANEASEDTREAGRIGMGLGIMFELCNDQVSAIVMSLLLL